jgi:hypothetical protein
MQRHYRINLDLSETTLFDVSSRIGDYQSEAHGFDIEGYHKRLRQGDLMPHTPFERWKYEFLCAGIFHRYQTDGYSFHTPLYWTNDWATDSLVKQSIAVPRAAAKLKDYGPQMQAAASRIYSQGHDSLTFVAELTKTISMFKKCT